MTSAPKDKPARGYQLHEGMKDLDRRCPCGDPITIHPTGRCRRCLMKTLQFWGPK